MVQCNRIAHHMSVNCQDLLKFIAMGMHFWIAYLDTFSIYRLVMQTTIRADLSIPLHICRRGNGIYHS